MVAGGACMVAGGVHGCGGVWLVGSFLARIGLYVHTSESSYGVALMMLSTV